MLLLVGQGPLKELIEKKVKLLNLEKNVKFLGQRKDVEKSTKFCKKHIKINIF